MTVTESVIAFIQVYVGEHRTHIISNLISALEEDPLSCKTEPDADAFNAREALPWNKIFQTTKILSQIQLLVQRRCTKSTPRITLVRRSLLVLLPPFPLYFHKVRVTNCF